MYKPLIILFVIKLYACNSVFKYSSQHCLIAMLESFKKAADDGNEFGSFSEAFDCILHKFLIAKIFTEFHLQLFV